MSIYLTPDETIDFKIGNETLTIKVKIIPDGKKATKAQGKYIKIGDLIKPNALLHGNGIPQGITIHNTDFIKTNSETNPAEQYTRATYPNENMNGTVVHYYVYKNEIWKNLKDSERGWHATDENKRIAGQRKQQLIGGNLDTIAIECIETGYDAETEKTVAMLTAYLLNKYNLNPETDIYTHNYFYNSKKCPLYMLPHWNIFINQVKSYYDMLKNKTYKIQVGNFISKTNALEYLSMLKEKGIDGFIVDS